MRLHTRFLLLAGAGATFFVALAQGQDGQKEPTCEQVFKNIQVFKGVPASDLIPAMQFMSASLKYECEDCHNQADLAADTRTKETARHMILMQRDINTKNFGGRTEVTCFTCHGGKEHPAPTPNPSGAPMRHPRLDNAPKPEDVFAMASKAMGPGTGKLVRTGTLTAPNDMTHKVETKKVVFTQQGDDFSFVTDSRAIASEAGKTTYNKAGMGGEPAFTFERFGRNWRDAKWFAGLSKPMVTGQDKIAKADVITVRGTRDATGSTEELSFDAKTHDLLRLVNMKRSSLGMVVTVIDYSDYRGVKGVRVPRKMTVTFPTGVQWIFSFDKVDLS